MHINRRDVVRGALVLAAGLAFPLPFRAFSRTPADRLALSIARKGVEDGKYCLQELKVHPWLREQMSLRSIDGVDVEAADGLANRHNYVLYYHVKYVRESDGKPKAEDGYLPLGKVRSGIQAKLRRLQLS